MKKLLLLTAIAIFASCSRDCDEAKESIRNDYYRALQGVNGNPDAANEITRQYNNRMNQLDC